MKKKKCLECGRKLEDENAEFCSENCVKEWSKTISGKSNREGKTNFY